MKYLAHLGVACTQFLNTLLGGWPDESTSSRSYRSRHKPHWYVMYRLVNTAFFWQDDHCKMAWEQERWRRHHPPEMRE